MHCQSGEEARVYKDAHPPGRRQGAPRNGDIPRGEYDSQGMAPVTAKRTMEFELISSSPDPVGSRLRAPRLQ